MPMVPADAKSGSLAGAPRDGSSRSLCAFGAVFRIGGESGAFNRRTVLFAAVGASVQDVRVQNSNGRALDWQSRRAFSMGANRAAPAALEA